jgi:hypothetical protein
MKAQAKSFLIWTLVIVLFLVIFWPEFKPLFLRSLVDITAMLQNFPRVCRRIRI